MGIKITGSVFISILEMHVKDFKDALDMDGDLEKEVDPEELWEQFKVFVTEEN